MKATHEMIARQVGVSRVAVSQVLHRSRSSRISEETRSEVLRIAGEIGYRPRNRTTHTIGYVVPVRRMTTDSEVQFLQQVQQELSVQGYHLVLVDLDIENLASMEQSLNPKTVDGVILRRWLDGRVQHLMSPDVPWVLAADEYGIGPEVDQVAPDAADSMRVLMDHMIGQGHRDFCLVTGPAGIRSHDLIKQQCVEMLTAVGRKPDERDFIEVASPACIAPLLLKRLAQSRLPTAVIGLGFSNVMSVLNVLQSEAYRVPDQISVASVTDSDSYQWLYPSITAVTMGGADLATQCVRRLLEKLENPDLESEKLFVRGELVERMSVRPLSEAGLQ